MSSKSTLNVGFVVSCLLKSAVAFNDGQNNRAQGLKHFYELMLFNDGNGFYCEEGELVGKKCLIGPSREADNNCGGKEVHSGKCHVMGEKNESRGCTAKDKWGDSLANYCDESKATALIAEGLKCNFLYREDDTSCTLVTNPPPLYECIQTSWREGVTASDKKGHCVFPSVVRPGGACTSPAKNRGDGKCAKLVEEVAATENCPAGYIPHTADKCKKINDPNKTAKIELSCASLAWRLDSEAKKCKRWEVVAEVPSCLEGQGTADGKGYCYSETTDAVRVECMDGTLSADETQCTLTVSSSKENGCRDGWYGVLGKCRKHAKTTARFTCKRGERKVTYAEQAVKNPQCITVTREVPAKEN